MKHKNAGTGYLGSKGQAGVFHRIIGQMRPHSFYWEPFAGTAQVFKRKRLADESFLTDIDPTTVARLRRSLGKLSIAPAVKIKVGDGLALLAQEGNFFTGKKAVVYCDPPYLLHTRTSHHRYDHEMTDDHHEQLLKLIQNLNCDVLISGYPSKLYDDRLKKWRRIAYQTRTRGRTLTEILWCNFSEPTELHDWNYAGQNFRQRTQLKRMSARWLARLDDLPPRKRGFLLEAIRQRHFGT